MSTVLKPVPSPINETIDLGDARLAELQRRQDGGQPEKLDLDDPAAVLRVVTDHFPKWLKRLEIDIEESERTTDRLRELKKRVEALSRRTLDV